MTTDTTKLDDALAMYVKAVKEAMNKRYEAYEHVTPPTISTTRGKRYIRIVETATFGSGRGVHSFVDTANGDILKADSWKKPAKHARGNIFSDKHGGEAMGPDGFIHYLK